MFKTIFEKSQSLQHAYSLPKSTDLFQAFLPPKEYLRKQSLDLPEVSEIDLTRHFSNLAKRNAGIDTHFYPLGSCTMKLNPRINEWCANLPGFTRTHPLAPDDTVQGNLKIINDFIELLCQLCGMEGGSLVPNAGAQGELTGIQMIAAYHQHRGDSERNEILIPDNAHGTNAATAAMAGFKIIPIKSNAQGDLDIDELKKLVSSKTAGLMLTNPNTLGLFSEVILEIAEIVHEAGGLLYYDGANLNSILNIVRPGEMGFDVMHINLHKTFSTPHGGGGPGAGPVLCKKNLISFLPIPKIYKDGKVYRTQWNDSKSVGQVASYWGNFGIIVRAFLYAKLHGFYGMRRIAEVAVLNANYLKTQLAPYFTVPFPQICMHEFVVQANKDLDKGVRALDIAKRLLDYGVYAPTIYFPIIIQECMLIEPTESESKQTLDDFVGIIKHIFKEIKDDPEKIKQAPYFQVVSRLDEVRAIKQPILKHISK
ncbi:MAG: aminomethyl-transferring glycine dehydrogenase subunit GcvPB [Parachlamydiaceae bacterium]|nr:aminomethyl-transferring glycine dehydrogenase subunit GcvPB [Parachlamydiaceae bacterium]